MSFQRITYKGIEIGEQNQLGEFYSLSQPIDWEKMAQVFELLKEPCTLKELRERIGVRDASYFKTNYINPFMESGYFEMTIPDKPKSRFQKYRLSVKGRQLLNELSKSIQNN